MPPYKVNKAEALRYVGYAGQPIDGMLDARVDELIAACETRSAPAFVHASFPVEEVPGGIKLVGTSLVLPGESIAEHLRGARECAVMAATLGLANERAALQLKAKSMLDAVVFGAAGSALVECVADACEAAVVESAAARGLRANWRFSPGYGDLPLSLQPEILRVLGAEKRLGLSCTPTYLLTPTKSVTALVGLFDPETPAPGVRRSCKTCACANHCTLLASGHPCWSELRQPKEKESPCCP